MRTLAILLVNFVIFANGNFTIFPTLTSGFMRITCTYEDPSLSNLQKIISLVINKYNVSSDGHQEVENSAYVNVFQISKSNFSNAGVSGHVGDTLFSNITVAWQSTSISLSLEGGYECELYGIDQDALPVVMTTGMTLHFSDMDPVISAKPDNIEEVLTSSLLVECAVINMNVHDVTRIISFQIFHDFNGTSELIFSYPDRTTASGWAIVSYYNYDNRIGPLYFAVSKNNPTVDDSGMYTCNITGYNNTDFVSKVTILRDTNVTFSTTGIKEAYKNFCDNNDLPDYILFACNFENGLCGMKTDQPTFPGLGWKLMQGRIQKVPFIDYYRAGYYLHVSPEKSGKFTVETALFQPRNRQICVSLWYSALNSAIAKLSMYTRQINNASTEYAISIGFSSQEWTFYRQTFPSPDYPFVVGIQAVTDYSSSMIYMVDDIQISDMNCFKTTRANNYNDNCC